VIISFVFLNYFISFADAGNLTRKERERLKFAQQGFASEEDLYRDINACFLREDYAGVTRLSKQYLSIGYKIHEKEASELEALSRSKS